MNARGVIRLQMKKVTDVWNRMFREDKSVTDPQDAIYNEIEDYLPYYVVVESYVVNSPLRVESYSTHFGCPMDEIKITGRICFVNKKYDESTALGWMLLNMLNWDIVCQQLYNLQPEEIELAGNKCYRVPLGSVDVSKQKDINAYLHNLMFWESMLDKEFVGPLSLRYMWVLEKLYTQKASIDNINDVLRKANVYSEENADCPEKGVKELSDNLETATISSLQSDMAESERLVAEANNILRENGKVKILNTVAVLKDLFLYTVAKLTEKNTPFSDMSTTQQQLEDDKRNLIRTIETHLSDIYDDIQKDLMKL